MMHHWSGTRVVGALVAGVGLLCCPGATSAIVYDPVAQLYTPCPLNTAPYYLDAPQVGTNGWYYGYRVTSSGAANEAPDGSYTLLPASFNGFYRGVGWGLRSGSFLASPYIINGSEAANGYENFGGGNRLAMPEYTDVAGASWSPVLVWQASASGTADIGYFLRSTNKTNPGNHIQAWLSKWDGVTLTNLAYIDISAYSDTYSSLAAAGVLVHVGDQIQLLIGPKGNGAYDGSLVYGSITFVPEPATLIVLLVGAALVGWRRHA